MPANTRSTTNDPDVYAAIKRALAALDEDDCDTALRLLHAVYGKGIEGMPAEGLSAYGLCLARVEKKNKIGIDYCNRAIGLQSYDSGHYINLIKLYLHAKSRKRAVEILEKGMKLLPKDEALLQMRTDMKYRAPSPIGFLHRDNFLNQILGRLRYNPKAVFAAKLTLIIAFFLLLFSLTFYFLERWMV